MDPGPSSERSSPDLPVTATTHESEGPGINAPQDATPGPEPSAAHSDTPAVSLVVDSVLRSDIGVNTLLSRLKQSIASAREFAGFLKKRSTLEEEQAQGLKKLCRASHETARRPENRQGSYVQSYDEVVRIHDRMADNGVQFALSLHQMHEDLHELASNLEKGRKLWKQNGLAAEKRVQDAEALMEKAKTKYNSLAEDYDRARTGDKGSGRVFGLKGPKSAAQHEEDLQRKVQQADSDYSSRVQAARSQRQELVATLRPQAIRALQELINECDSGLTLQLQKFASYNERLLLGNGLCVSPLQGQPGGPNARSLREIVSQIDNSRDLNTFVSSFSSQVPNSGDIKYEKHPTLNADLNAASVANARSGNQAPAQTHGQVPQSAPPAHISTQQQAAYPGSVGSVPPPSNPSPTTTFGGSTAPQRDTANSPKNQSFSQTPYGGPPQSGRMQGPPHMHAQPPAPFGMSQNNASSSSLPALRPVFGVPLDDLLRRDGSAVPLVVYQCIQAVDLFGLEVEGIYRLSGSAASVNKLKGIFDHDSHQVDFRNPESFYHDVNSVAGLLKQFFRDLPDPLLTAEHYHKFIEAARNDDDTMRRDSIHATINELPDPNYATLRALTLHLNRVQEHSSTNRMNAGNLAIIFGPTLMGSGPDVADAGWQVRAIDTILQNTYQIFDDD